MDNSKEILELSRQVAEQSAITSRLVDSMEKTLSVLEVQSAQMTKITTLLFDDNSAGHTGTFSKMNIHEDRLNQHEQWIEELQIASDKNEEDIESVRKFDWKRIGAIIAVVSGTVGAGIVAAFVKGKAIIVFLSKLL